MLSGVPLPESTPPTNVVALPAIHSGLTNNAVTNFTSPLPNSLDPAQVRQAYGFNQITYNNGTNSLAGDGSGQTIAIVEAFNDPNLAADLATFDSTYGIASPPDLKVVDQSGPDAPLPGTNAGWALETSLDVEWAHAIAPGANILVVEANSSGLNDLLGAVKYAASQPGVSTVSMSWGSSEFAGETALDSTFAVPGVTFVAASGDGGGSSGADWPASSPDVVAVGGTSLSLNPAGSYGSESAWSGSGGGVSSYETTPGYQQDAFPGQLAGRTTPDVSYNANPSSGFAVYDSLGLGHQAGWFKVGGTSAGAPQWAGLVAIADQGRALNHLGTLGSQDTLGLLYGRADTLYQGTPSAYFHDVTAGSNANDAAVRGYDPVTGLGSPKANALVNDLSGGTGTTTPTATPTPTPTAGASPASAPTSPTAARAPVLPHAVPAPLPILIGFTTTNAAGTSPFAPVVIATPPPVTVTPSSNVTVTTLPTTSPPTITFSVDMRGQSLEVPIEVEPARLFLGNPIRSPELPDGPRQRFSPFPAPIDTPTEPQDGPAEELHRLPAFGPAIALLGKSWFNPEGRPPLIISLEPIPTEDNTPSTVESGLMAGVAVALWGAWETRPGSRGADPRRSRKRPIG